jgi:hypothetical protein
LFMRLNPFKAHTGKHFDASSLAANPNSQVRR